MRKVLAISRQTLSGYVRDRIFHSVLLFSFLFVGFSFFLSMLTIVESGKILLDFGLSAISLMGIFLGLFLGVTSVGREMDRGTIYTVLSKPISRTEYLLGKVLGASVVIFLVHLLNYLVLLLIVYHADESIPAGLLAAVFLMILESILVMLVGLFLSLCLSSFFLVASISLAIFLIGRSAGTLKSVYDRLDSGAVKYVVRVIYDLIPALERFNIREVVAYGKPYPPGMVGESLLYFLAYAAFLIGISFLVFRRKDLR